MTTNLTHTIGGRGIASEQFFDVIDPASGAPFARCPDATRADLDAAVQAARTAFGPWSRLSFAERRELIGRFADKLSAIAGDAAALLTREQGKPLAMAKREAGATPWVIKGMAGVDLPEAEVLRDNAEERIVLRYRPLGVVAAIAPWNVPLILGFAKVAQALFTGNTVVLKPSPLTPLSTLLFGEASRGVLPDGVLNVVAGGNELGAWMTEHPGIDKVSFTGSVVTGKRVLASAAGTLKRVTLELGGNDPAILLDDADLDTVVPKIFQSAFNNCGQICFAIKRVYVPDALYERACAMFVQLATALKVGGGFEPDVQMGPLQNEVQYRKVLELLEDTRCRPGARILCGGAALDRPGYFVAPTIVAGLDDHARLVVEEQFGPVLPILRYSDIDDAIRRANDSRLGLCASVWTHDPARAEAVAARLEAGTVSVNFHGGSDAEIPFSGAKESGLGQERGVMGLRSYMEPQVMITSRSGA